MKKSVWQTGGILMILLLCFLLHSCIRGSVYTATYSTEGIIRPPQIRVALTNEEVYAFDSVQVAVDGRYEIRNARGDRVLLEGESLSAGFSLNNAANLILGNRELNLREVRVTAPGSNPVMAFGKSYRGDLYLFVNPRERKIVVCNELTLEDYLRGVLPSEMPMSYHESALQAQSVAARTYALYEMQSQSLRKTMGFDVYDDTRSQVYGGIDAEHPVADKVIQSTRGVVLTWRGRIFKTYFSATCGGQTDAGDRIFGDVPLPPLSGATCGFCDHAKYFKWGPVVVSFKTAEKKLFPDDTTARIRSARISRISAAGSALEVEVMLKDGRTEVFAASDVRTALNQDVPIQSPKRIRSARMKIEVIDGKLRIYGSGWGHGVGLCQEGARGMARTNASAASILLHYYSGSKLHKMY